MAYILCHACGTTHSKITPKEVGQLVEEYQSGTGQIVTSNGIRSLCVLQMLGRGKRGQPVLSDV